MNTENVTTADTEMCDTQTLFLDQVISNNIAQDVSSVCCLLDAVFARVRLGAENCTTHPPVI